MSVNEFQLPERLPGELRRILEYWKGLRRAENAIPFWDDVNLSALPDVAGQVILVRVFHDPLRFRIDDVGSRIAKLHVGALSNRFADELAPASPLEDFIPQATATVEIKAGTFFQHRARLTAESNYSRLLLPLWGEGEIRRILGGFSFIEFD